MKSTACLLLLVLLSGAAPYRLSSAPTGATTLERGGKRVVYQPVFTIIRSESDPQLGLSRFASTPGESLEGVNVENYPLPRWRAASGNGMTDVLYDAGSVTEVRAASADRKAASSMMRRSPKFAHCWARARGAAIC